MNFKYISRKISSLKMKRYTIEHVGEMVEVFRMLTSSLEFKL